MLLLLICYLSVYSADPAKDSEKVKEKIPTSHPPRFLEAQFFLLSSLMEKTTACKLYLNKAIFLSSN